MKQVQTRGRHLAPRTAPSRDARLGRATVAALASTGLVFGVGAAATAAPESDTISKPGLKDINFSAQEIDRAAVQSAVVVDGDTELNFAAATITAEEPPPPPAPVERTVETTSRTRTADTTTEGTATATTQSTESAEAAPAAEATPQESVEETSTPTAAASGIREAIVNNAYQYLGTPYGTGAGQLDCSSFVQLVFANVGISLPRTSGAQASAGYRVSASEALPGDLVYTPGHIGIYLGNGQHIAARNPSTPLSAGPIYMSAPQYIRVVG
ncbi:C40 family peptidase [Serinibacter salmoneus]|uniref:Cell wall-associated NlpC family hydrolase n=1 Tax=Serinibacter salmoneus TaxID=556530 RepID=A0A2A9D1H8_9MICO|nr:C40 family peptidase [Serinibacter salmoneus]PFG20503.1 cell wall-associated NlpC family hydrolase [Serinibacter salmoneus]